MVFWTDYKRKHEVLAAAVRELAWAVEQTPFPFYRVVEDCDRWDDAYSMSCAVIREMKE